MAFKVHAFSLILIHHPETGRFVAVDESRDRGIWIPGGHVEHGEDFTVAALREAREEAGISIVLKGILRVEYNLISAKDARMRVIFYAHPADKDAKLKSVADEESNAAFWVDVPELEKLTRERKMRGPELLEYARYVADGGTISSLDVMSAEDAPMRDPATSGGFSGVGVAPKAAVGATSPATAAVGGGAAASVGSSRC